MLELNNKKILVMGASGNIGKKIAIKLSKLGAKVVISGRDEKKLKETLCELEGKGHYSLVFDVKEVDKIMDFMKSILEIDNQKLAGLVYSAGIIPIHPIKNTTYSFLHDIMLVNYYAFAEMVRCYANKKISGKGSIVVLSSYAAINGDKGQLAYSASKGAIDSSIIVMGKELYSKGIRVNAIRPAIVSSEDVNEDDLSSGIKDTINKMRTGPIDPENIAEQVAFLLSEYSSGVYGRCFDVRGYLS